MPVSTRPANTIQARAIELGRLDYAAAHALQLRLVESRVADAICDTLLVVEHPEVLTVGRRLLARSNVLDSSLPLFEVERGGDVTWHGPGQLVAYPILKLDERERDLHAYLRALEQGLIDTVNALGLSADRRPGLTGVWIGERKVASIGIAVRRWVTFHGVALNVATDLRRFSTIHPCGLDAAVMTSLSVAAGRPYGIDEVSPLLVAALGRALGRDFSAKLPPLPSR